MQPFKKESRYLSKVWPELTLMKKEDHLLFHSEQTLETVSSALYGGGFRKLNYFVNWQVPKHFDCNDPFLAMEQQLDSWGYPLEESAGLQTAAWIHWASIQEEAGDQFKAVCCVTAGVGNRERAGIRRPTYPAYQPGTINTFLFIDGRLTQPAMVNAIMTAAEAKAAAMQDVNILIDTDAAATGTTTDSVVIAASQAEIWPLHLYAGTATSIGNSIGCLVYDAVCEAVRNGG
ncbi:adenosylcobinamide amidohydrolase [Peribacillus sp. SCS-26]|uniref:adenosylcobinamide amidohydrolase n=1 Tax=Paraperibacillus marinus TaxID=3115295 RepID=UPI003905C01C